MKITIDAKDMLLGRLSSNVARLALSGKEVQIINCEEVVVSGKKKIKMAQIKHLRKMGSPFKGPFYPKQPYGIVKRSIKGMLPHKNTRGKEALKRIRCFNNKPDEIKIDSITALPDAMSDKVVSTKKFTIKQLVR